MTYDYKGFEFDFDRYGNITPVRRTNAKAATIEFPSEVDGKKVKKIRGERLPHSDADDVKSVIIPDTVTCIRSLAFEIYKNLETVVVGDKSSLTEIESFAFSGCKKLTSVDHLEKIERFGEGCFENCESLKSLHIGPKVEYIHAESLCKKGLESIIVDENNEFYESIDNCLVSRETQAVVAGCINSIIPGDPEKVVRIGKRAFEGVCFSKQLEKIPDNIRVIQKMAFHKAKGMKNPEMPDGLEIIDEKAFMASDIESVVFGPGLLTVENEAFRDCKYLQNVDMSRPEKFSNLGNALFFNCQKLGCAVLPYGPTRVSMHLFECCTDLYDVVIQSSYKSIGARAFAFCPSLDEVDLADTNIESIEHGAFASCVNLVEMRVPDSIKEIGEKAFSDCRSLEYINLPEGLRTIGPYAFENSALFGLLKLPDSIESVATHAFRNNRSLIGVRLPPCKEKGCFIASTAFAGCETPFAVMIPEEKEDIAFHNIDFIREIKCYEDSLNPQLNFYFNNNETTFLEYFPDTASMLDKNVRLGFVLRKDENVFLVPFGCDKHYDVREEAGSADIRYNVIEMEEHLPKRSVDEDIRSACETALTFGGKSEEIGGDEHGI